VNKGERTACYPVLTQLFGDRLLIANATGCSSIYGSNLPTTSYTTNCDGRDPAWSNSLFEDNAEVGLGLRLGVDAHGVAAPHYSELEYGRTDFYVYTPPTYDPVERRKRWEMAQLTYQAREHGFLLPSAGAGLAQEDRTENSSMPSAMALTAKVLSELSATNTEGKPFRAGRHLYRVCQLFDSLRAQTFQAYLCGNHQPSCGRTAICPA
jgi:hypothetical protein